MFLSFKGVAGVWEAPREDVGRGLRGKWHSDQVKSRSRVSGPFSVQAAGVRSSVCWQWTLLYWFTPSSVFIVLAELVSLETCVMAGSGGTHLQSCLWVWGQPDLHRSVVKEHWLLLQRIQILLPEPTRWLKTICSSSYRGLGPIF